MVEERDYPVLFGTTQATWAPIDLRFILLTGEVDPGRIARVYVVPFVGDACVVVGFQHGDWGPAGGGLEPGETVQAALDGNWRKRPGAGCSPTPRSPCCAATPGVLPTAPTCHTLTTTACTASATSSWSARPGRGTARSAPLP